MRDDNTWHWLAYRVNAGNMTLWLDGATVGSGNPTYGTGTTITDSGVRNTIFGGGHDDFAIDDFKVWNYALSDNDLQLDFHPVNGTVIVIK